MGNTWDIIKNSESVVDLISNLIEDAEIQDGQPKDEKPKPKPAPNRPKKPTSDLPDFPTGNVGTVDMQYLHPYVQNAALEAMKQCGDAGYTVSAIETYRTPDRQSELYAQGRTEPGNIVTQAEPFESYHNYGLAIDISPINNAVGEIFEGCGFEWGARWKSFKDTPHFQMSFGLSVSELKELYGHNGIQSVWDYITKEA